ncbi:hypothetical protein AAF712_015329 [Marasmius tenuissimus]|uniref:Uncharacterized protein n=1 Tax=Marasmius tenuissimus TaxID=585030 RepID=A0ABR2Z9R0_9AGAR
MPILLEHEKEHQEARVRLQEAKELLRIAADRASVAKANVRTSNEEVGNRLTDLKDINDKMRRLLEMDALDEWTDSDGSNSSKHSSPPSPTQTSGGGWVYDPSLAGWGNGSGTWGDLPVPKEEQRLGESAEEFEVSINTSNDELGDLSIQGPRIPKVVVEPGSKFPAYVVYYGTDSAHGLFTGWKSTSERLGAKSLCQNDSHIVKGFVDPKVAAELYQEFVQSDAPKVLAHSPCENERFIVVEGAAPGVYEDRKTLIIFGLQYRGGRIRHFVGGRGDAQAQFSEWKAKGFVKTIKST